MKNLKSILTAFLLALPISLITTGSQQTPSWAALRICNRTSRPISVAIAYPKNQRIDCCGEPENIQYDPNAIVCYVGCLWSWTSKGWWNLNPGECQTPLGRDLRYANAVYVHVSSEAGLTYRDKASFCVTPQAFTINHWGNPLQCQPMPRVRNEDFKLVEIRGNRNITLNIPESKNITLNPPTLTIGQISRGGLHLQSPVWSIQACSAIGNIEGNLPVTCVGEGGGKNGFWGRKPIILVRFRNLPLGTHSIRARYYAYNRSQGRYLWTRGRDDQNIKFTNQMENWAFWFPATARPGEGGVNFNVDIILDGAWRGSLRYSGSPD
ncbi:MAG: DUF1036 domain-containing protein [Phormidium sp.]